MKRRRWIGLSLAAALATSGCYGPFRLTKRLHAWNGQVGEKWVQEAVFLGMVLLPVYAFASLADAVVFNSLEFWGKQNPMAAKDGERETVLSFRDRPARLRVDSFERGRPVATLILAPRPDGRVAALDGEGRLLGTAEREGAETVIRGAGGEVRGRFSPGDLERALKG